MLGTPTTTQPAPGAQIAFHSTGGSIGSGGAGGISMGGVGKGCPAPPQVPGG